MGVNGGFRYEAYGKSPKREVIISWSNALCVLMIFPEMAKQEYAAVSKTADSDIVWVQVPLSGPIFVVGIVRPVLESPIVDNRGLAAQLGENLRPLNESMSEWKTVPT